MRRTQSRLFIASARPSRLEGNAAAHLRLLPGDEAALLEQLLNQKSDDQFAAFCDQIITDTSNGQSITLLVGSDLLRAPNAGVALARLAELYAYFSGQGKEVALQFLFDRPNQLGAWEMGLAPNSLPGLGALDDQDALDRLTEAWGTPLKSNLFQALLSPQSPFQQKRNRKKKYFGKTGSNS